MKNPAITSNNLPAIGDVVSVRHMLAPLNAIFPEMFGEFTVSDIEYDDGKTFLHLFGRQFPADMPNPNGANPEQWRLHADAASSGCTWVSGAKVEPRLEAQFEGPVPDQLMLDYDASLPEFTQGDTVYLNVPKEDTRFLAFMFSPVNQSSPLTYEGIDEAYDDGGYIVNVGFKCPQFGQITQRVHSSELSLTPSGDQRPDIIESFDELSTPPMETPAEPTAPMTRKVLEMFRAKGSITALEAGGVLKCRSLPYQVFKLKELGHEITTEMKKDPMDGQTYARYHYIPAAA